MTNKKNEVEFTVTDRRRFVEGGADEATNEREESKPAVPVPQEQARAESPLAAGRDTVAEMAPDLAGGREDRPTEAQRAESDRAYRQSTAGMDDQIRRELGGQATPEDFKVGFDRVVEPLYVTTLVQLGFMGQEEQNQRRVDIIGARQSIDALNLLQEKTKGNLTPSESTLLEDILYDLRMKYLEITNALARAVQNPPEGKAGGKK
jgi:hypothetical protein